MGEVFRLPTAADRFIAGKSLQELRDEWRQQENALMAAEDDLIRVAHAIWPDEGERPESLNEGAPTVAEMVAGARSLHELIERLYLENALLRVQQRGAARA